MEISSVLTMSIVIVLLTLMIVFSMELLIPIQVKFEMNGICRGYIYKLESNGFLTDDENQALIEALENIGLENIDIDVESQGLRYGDQVVVSISGEYSNNRLVSLYKRDDQQLLLSYKRIYFVRKIKN